MKKRWQKTEAIFHEALGAEEPQRTALITSRCGDDTTLMAELRSLLAACEAEEVHRLSIDMDGVLPGTAIGPYIIDRLIGRGGMGAVYRAHRADGQFEQQVAIKIIDTPLASSFFRERFRAERQILARLAHPHIARLLDGGVSEADELYLVMEFIAGDSITDFCSKRSLSVEDRLQLFLLVCGAVQYAHGHLIVHRDLKPENILVAEDGCPRLLDFGTAKIIQPLTEGVTGHETRSDLRTFTPRYASPEKVLEQPISVASDVYSLGILLYVLLTDRHPYEFGNFSTEELVRVICNTQPRRPSATTSPFGKIDADLDSILLRALRKDPKERYATVGSLASDLHAYLHHRPVEARKGNLRYLAGKFARRNQLGLPSDSATATQHSLQILLHAAQGPTATANNIAAAVDAELNAHPTSVMDLTTAVSLARAGVELTHHREADFLLLLAQAYHAKGDQANATKTATEGLALLPVARPGEPVPRLRRLFISILLGCGLRQAELSALRREDVEMRQGYRRPSPARAITSEQYPCQSG